MPLAFKTEDRACLALFYIIPETLSHPIIPGIPFCRQYPEIMQRLFPVENKTNTTNEISTIIHSPFRTIKKSFSTPHDTTYLCWISASDVNETSNKEEYEELQNFQDVLLDVIPPNYPAKTTVTHNIELQPGTAHVHTECLQLINKNWRNN